MKLIQSIKAILKMESITEKINSMLLDNTPTEIDLNFDFPRHIKLQICDMVGINIILEGNNGDETIWLHSITPSYAVFTRQDGSRLGRNLDFCDDIYLAEF